MLYYEWQLFYLQMFTLCIRPLAHADSPPGTQLYLYINKYFINKIYVFGSNLLTLPEVGCPRGWADRNVQQDWNHNPRASMTAIESVYSTLVKTASRALIMRQRVSEMKCCFSNIYGHVLVHNSPLKWWSKVELCHFDSALAILWMSGEGQFTCGILLKAANVSEREQT